MTRQIFILTVFSGLFFGCADNQTIDKNAESGQTIILFTETERKLIAGEIRQTLDNYYADIRTDGLTAEFKYLDSSLNFFWIPPGYPTSISYDSVAIILKKNAPLYKSIDNSWDTLQIFPLNRQLATYTGRLHSIMTDTLGKVSEFRLVETGLLIKQKGGWKLLNGQTSILNGDSDVHNND